MKKVTNKLAIGCLEARESESRSSFGGIVAPVFQAVAPVGFRDVAFGALSGVSLDVITHLAHVVDLVIGQVRFMGSLDVNNLPT